MTTTMRIALLAAAAAGLVACTSTVVRTSGPTSQPRVSTPKYGATVPVRRGDTLYGIAFRNGVDFRDLAAWNGISAPYTIYPGQSLRLYPRGSRGNSTTKPSPPPSASPRTPAAVSTTTASTAPAARASAVPPPAPGATTPRTPAKAPGNTTAPASAVATAPRATAAVASDISWHWPADGELVNRFVAGEPTRQGVDIAGDGGAPVNAAADGVVVYSGSGLVGYGELIIVKHNDAWLSAYGHNRARMVNEGAIVKKGQQIAVMGRTGAPRDMLHFEIRHNGKPVDPLVYLPKR